MKSKWPVACVVIAIASFVAGRFTATDGGTPQVAHVGEDNHRVSSRSATAHEEEEPDAGIRRQTTRPSRPPVGKEPRVSVPLIAVTEILKESQFAYSDFEVINRKMPDALTILGASDSDKEAALDVMTASHQQILDEEKKHVRVASADDSGITLDRSAMEEPSKQVIANTQKGLRESLPSVVAEALIGSIDWDRYYFNPTKTTSFKISRSASGSLAATVTTGNGAMSTGLRPTEYPNDGTPVPAEAVFDKRWAPFLQGRTLLPVDN